MNEKIVTFFRQNIGYFIVAVTSVIYILTAVFTIDKTDKSLAQIFADGAISFLLGMFINRIFDLQGMMNGDRDERVLQTKENHSELVMRISPYIDKLDDWCEEENKKNYKIQRTKILARVGLKYDECFDEDGTAKGWVSTRPLPKELRRVERLKYRGYLKAVNLKLTTITTSDLTSEGGKQNDTFDFVNKTKASYERNKTISGLVSKVGMAVIFGLYGIKIIQDFNYENLIWTGLQVCLFLCMGAVSMYQSYLFVVEDYRGKTVKQIDNLQKFENYIKTEERKNAEIYDK